MRFVQKPKKVDNFSRTTTINRRDTKDEEKDHFYWVRLLCSDMFDLKPIKILVTVVTLGQIATILVHFWYFLKIFDVDALIKFVPIFAFSIYGLVNLICLVIFGSFIPKQREYKLWFNNSAGVETGTRIQQEVKIMKIFIVLNTLVTFIAGLTHAIPHKNDAEFFLVIKLLEETRTDLGMKLVKVYTVTNIFFIHCMVIAVYQFIYILQHMKIQLFLLRKSIENLSIQEKRDCELLYDQNYQKKIGRHLKFCIVRYQEILQASVNLSKEKSIFFVTLSASGCLHGIGAVIYLYTGVVSGNYARVAFTLTLFISTFWTIITVGQLLETEAEKLSKAVSEMAWYTWNQENKKILLIFLISLNKPLSFRFTDSIRVNYNLGLTIVKGIYSVASLFVQL